MRIPALIIALAFAGAATAAPPKAPEPDSCPKTTMQVADQVGSYRGKPVEPRKLTQMPPATGYMAVHRKIGGCEAPMSMVEYRRAPRR